MVIAQAAPATNPKDKDKPKAPAGADKKTQQQPAMQPAQKPGFSSRSRLWDSRGSKSRCNWK